jgi:predicted secreted protein
VTAMAVKKNGIALTFSSTLNPTEAANRENYTIEQWNYKWTNEYGSPEFKPSTGDKDQGHDRVEISKLTVSADGKSVFMEMPTQVVMQMRIKFKIESADGAAIEQEIFNTINHVPEQAGP